MKTLLVLGFLALILYNLGAGLCYMLVDKGATNRTVRSLAKRIALSVVLILLVAACIAPASSSRTASDADRASSIARVVAVLRRRVAEPPFRL